MNVGVYVSLYVFMHVFRYIYRHLFMYVCVMCYVLINGRKIVDTWIFSGLYVEKHRHTRDSRYG